MALKALSVDKKSSWFKYPEIPEFEVEVAALSRKKLTELYERNTVSKDTFNAVKSTYVENKELDIEKYSKDFSSNVILNWKGLKLKHLEILGLFEIGDADPETDVEYTKEDAADLLQCSNSFDNWVAGVTGNIANFRRKPKTGAVPTAGELAEVE